MQQKCTDCENTLNCLFYSGGADSTYILQQHTKAFDHIFYCNSGFSYNNIEHELIVQNLMALGILEKLENISLSERQVHKHYQGRILEMFLRSAIFINDKYERDSQFCNFWIGFHYLDTFQDSSMNFILKMEDILNYSFRVKFRILAPLYYEDKKEYVKKIIIPFNTLTDERIADSKLEEIDKFFGSYTTKK